MNGVSINMTNIFELEQNMSSLPNELQSIPPVSHCFAPGAYARTMLIPAGTLIVGKIHRHEHLNIISYGDVSVATYEGPERLFGFNIFKSAPNVKRAVYANEDTMWTTIHPTNETDLEKIEDDVIIKMEAGEEMAFVEKMQKMLIGDI